MYNSPKIKQVLIQVEEDYLLSTGWIKRMDQNTGKTLWLGEHNNQWKSRDRAIFEQKSIEYNQAIKDNTETDWEI